jgi:hypothetical protein
LEASDGSWTAEAPVLILFFGIARAESVGAALISAAAIKLPVAPIYLFRWQVHLKML